MIQTSCTPTEGQIPVSVYSPTLDIKAAPPTFLTARALFIYWFVNLNGCAPNNSVHCCCYTLIYFK